MGTMVEAGGQSLTSCNRVSLVGRRELPKFLPGRTDRALFVGQTGCGKTTLARHLLRLAGKHVVVLDTKGTVDWSGYTKFTRLDQLAAVDPKKSAHLIYRPAIQEYNEDDLDRFFGWVYKRRNCILYIDEVFGAVQFGVSPWMLGCITRGRELGISVWSSVQRPSRIPMPVLTESEHLYSFRLALDDDRARVRELAGLSKEGQAVLPKFDFFHCLSSSGDIEGPYRLALKKG